MANRLSADPSKSVLLVEAGSGDGKNMCSEAPGAVVMNMSLPHINWGYNTTPQKHLANRELFYPRGRVLGGSSQPQFEILCRNW